ncbi:hypothetical protein LBMAG56_05610 [Verrucomicrobiota bacterium]|nr:hypothetical protein LBMAG56_05610 [Verrucomicrobiota bacterium]
MNRRSALKGLVGGVLGAGASQAFSAPATPGGAGGAPEVGSDQRAIWSLPRPKPALPNSYFWTWDHTTNWMLDDPGVLNFGCNNRYLKRPETFVEDYRRLTDLAAGLGVKGILIWGFLRDSHGGIESAKRVADYAAAKGVAILPGIGTNHYGGIYYEGRHRFNLETFIETHPDARMVDERGQPMGGSVCPSHPRFAEWLQQAVSWLFSEFAIGGANLENGDFFVCHCPRCQKLRPGKADDDEPQFWQDQLLGYTPALKLLEDRFKTKLITWATYKGFMPGRGDGKTHMGAYMGCQRPRIVDRLPPGAVAQWTLTRMVHGQPLPLTKFLDHGAPPEALTAAHWPADVKPPTARSVGFLHQGSQWHRTGTGEPDTIWSTSRYDQIVSTIKEGCLRAARAGLEGVSIHGEMSSQHVPWALNYLAFSHFTHWPEASLRQFGSKTLGPVLGSADEGEAFAETLAHVDAGTATDAQKNDAKKRRASLAQQVARGAQLQRWRFWNWLASVAVGHRERHTISPF